MPQQNVILKVITREDVSRINQWLKDTEISESWFGRYAYGDPAHLGYHPEEMEKASDAEWQRVFDNPEHRIMSIYNQSNEHIGEIHIAIEESLADGQLSLLIGRKDLWHQGYGTAATNASLELAFNEYGLYRIWVDIPEYNEAARHMFDRLGFVHEGTLRKSRPHEGARFDSVIMGILGSEYTQRAEDLGTQAHNV
ncbi:MAG: hypothetical protein BZY79_02720 [SAR202 cluster bacterium Casp-Chloro-G4]|nr:GNAT family protein [Chloroflexota bacterium]PKB61646.1 MAG: hypothetical protein BZY79_02720 [SAR202 cluster bacterium Casp-Chloro-G4]